MFDNAKGFFSFLFSKLRKKKMEERFNGAEEFMFNFIFFYVKNNVLKLIT